MVVPIVQMIEVLKEERDAAREERDAAFAERDEKIAQASLLETERNKTQEVALLIFYSSPDIDDHN